VSSPNSSGPRCGSRCVSALADGHAAPHELTCARIAAPVRGGALFGARSGLGYLIGVAEDSRRFDLMYVAIITVAIRDAVLHRREHRGRRVLEHRVGPSEPGDRADRRCAMMVLQRLGAMGAGRLRGTIGEPGHRVPTLQ
jgi:hypothetical protein